MRTYPNLARAIGKTLIVLMHLGASANGSTVDTKALPGVIRAIRARGYRFVTLRDVRGPR